MESINTSSVVMKSVNSIRNYLWPFRWVRKIRRPFVSVVVLAGSPLVPEFGAFFGKIGGPFQNITSSMFKQACFWYFSRSNTRSWWRCMK